MKKFLIVTFVILFNSVFFTQTNTTTQTTTAPIKIGFVDSETILKLLPEAVKAQGEIEALNLKYQGVLDSMYQSYQQMIEDYKKQSASMKEAAKKDAEQKIVKLEQNIRDVQAKLSRGGELAQLTEKLLKPILEKVKNMVEVVAKEEGMNFIFDKSDQLPVLIYADVQYEITLKVLDKLKKGK